MMLAEFPYTSGNLHIGHWFTYSISDIFTRYLRMNGYNVMNPIGFDAFGLPAENAAIKNNTTPDLWTNKNVSYMSKQLKSIGATFDWSRVVDTSKPDYYKWTQWIFLKLYKKGLAYRAATKVNWCPKDKTVLANEQVVNGCCERCDTPVVQKDLTQWMFKITDYADALIDDVKGLDWPEATKIAQINWMGRSEGAKIKFNLTDIPGQKDDKHFVEVFTTRPDTLFGATFLVISPELAQKWVGVGWKADKKVADYIDKSLHKKELERLVEAGDKTGVDTGVKAVNLATKEKIPVWVADYVLGGYGTGAIMAVPAHDQRDYEFAQKFKLPITQVIMPSLVDTSNPPREGKKEVFRNMVLVVLYNPKIDKYLTLKWKKLGWIGFITGGIDDGEDNVKSAQREILEETGYKNTRLIRSLGKTEAYFFAAHKDENRRSNAEHFLFELVDDSQDPITKKEEEQYELEWLSLKELHSVHLQHAESDIILKKIETGDNSFIGGGVLINSRQFDGMSSEKAKWEITKFVGAEKQTQYKLRDWVLSRQRYWGAPIPMISCPVCGYQPVAEKELPIKLPPLKNFKPADDGRSPLAKAKEWLKVKCPKCGGVAERETDTMDTFVDSSWYFMRYTDPKNKEEFASKKKMSEWLPVPMYIGGREHNTMHLLYARFITKALNNLGLADFKEPFSSRRNHGVIMGPDGKRMSKSRGNVVDPDIEVKKFGTDAVRINFAFMGPFDQDYAWNNNSINGIVRFLNRVWNYVGRYDTDIKPNSEARRILNKFTKEIGEDIKKMSFNTGVSGLMKLLNELESHEISKGEYEILLKLLAPFAPHLAEELWWSVFKNKKSIHLEKWPEYDEKLLAEEKVRLVVQVNGRVRDTVEVKKGLSEAEAKKMALASENAKKHIIDEVKKVVYIKDRVINIVV